MLWKEDWYWIVWFDKDGKVVWRDCWRGGFTYCEGDELSTRSVKALNYLSETYLKISCWLLKFAEHSKEYFKTEEFTLKMMVDKKGDCYLVSISAWWYLFDFKTNGWWRLSKLNFAWSVILNTKGEIVSTWKLYARSHTMEVKHSQSTKSKLEVKVKVGSFRVNIVID